MRMLVRVRFELEVDEAKWMEQTGCDLSDVEEDVVSWLMFTAIADDAVDMPTEDGD